MSLTFTRQRVHRHSPRCTDPILDDDTRQLAFFLEEVDDLWNIFRIQALQGGIVHDQSIGCAIDVESFSGCPSQVPFWSCASPADIRFSAVKVAISVNAGDRNGHIFYNLIICQITRYKDHLFLNKVLCNFSKVVIFWNEWTYNQRSHPVHELRDPVQRGLPWQQQQTKQKHLRVCVHGIG